MHRFLAIGLAVVFSLALCGEATAWSWPADGDVLRPFALGSDAYAAGQHRGIDVAGADGSGVRAPVSGVISFAGSLPTSGRGVTILTYERAGMVKAGSFALEQPSVDELARRELVKRAG